MEASVNRIGQEVWARLEQTQLTGDKLVARPAVPRVTDRVQCALDAQGKRHLLVALREGEDELGDTQSRGLSVVTRELAIKGQSEVRYIDIECHEASGHQVFDLVGAELAEELANSNGQPAENVKHVLARWRRFWGQMPQQLLSREEQLGLFAELWFLNVWLLPKAGPSAVFAWQGPMAARHDFAWLGKSIEIKATTNVRGRIHHVHGLDQLDPPENSLLYLFSLSLREEITATNDLPHMVEACRSQVISDDDALGRFETLLFKAGYSPVHDEEYVKLRLHVIEEALFVVKDDFPRVTPSSFPQEIPKGIERVEYEINLSSFSHLIIARLPNEWSP
jgi:hypothetical protein